MFFSQDILQRRGGKFGIVWIAATKFRSVSLTRREYLAVSVSKTCDDIVRYICLDAQPLKPHGPRPRLSLYLSSQLMFGVTRVYRKQMDIFNAEVYDLYMRFSSAKLTVQTFEATDLGQIKQQRNYKTGEFCTLQDPMRSDAEESDFGVMRFQKVTDLDPSQLPYIDFIQDLSPLFPVFAGSDQSISPQLGMPDAMLYASPHTVSDSSQISIKEIPEPSMPTIPGESDLMALDEPMEDFLQHIQLAMGTSFDTKRTTESQKKTRDRRQPVKPSDVKKARKMADHPELMIIRPELTIDQLDLSADQPELTVDQPDIPVDLFASLGSPPRGPLPTTRLDVLEEEPVIPPEPTTPKVPTQMPVLRLTPLLSPPEDASPPRRHVGRRRQLQFADVVDDFTQLSKQYIRDNMATSNDLCHTFAEVLPSVPELTAKELLALPGRRSITKSKTLMDLWRKQAVPYKPPQGPPSEEIPTNTWSTDYLNAKPGGGAIGASPQVSPPVGADLRQDTLEGSPEQLRDISVESVGKRLRFEETPTSFVISDASHLSESRDSTQPSSFQLETGTVRRKRRLTEQSIEEEVLGREEEEALLMAGVVLDDMPPVPEAGYSESLQGIPEAGKSPEISTSESEQLTRVPHPNVIRQIAELTAADEAVTFKDLVPLDASCRVAGKVFSVCLEYAALRLIKMHQELAYGDIYIRRGPLF